MLTPVERLPNSRLRCVCDCGNQRICRVGHFNAGSVRSCGCTRFHKRPEGAHGPCIVEGCDAQRCNSRGWCWMHYTRWRRHGDPHVTAYGQAQQWLDDHVGYEGDSCLLWPFGHSSTGYGTVNYYGTVGGAHRFMCRLAHGEPPSPDMQAAHRCGVRSCVNPKHLRWATQAENEADKIIHGTYNHGRYGRQRHA